MKRLLSYAADKFQTLPPFNGRLFTFMVGFSYANLEDDQAVTLSFKSSWHHFIFLMPRLLTFVDSDLNCTDCLSQWAGFIVHRVWTLSNVLSLSQSWERGCEVEVAFGLNSFSLSVLGGKEGGERFFVAANLGLGLISAHQMHMFVIGF